MDSNKDLLIIVALLVLLVVSIYQAFEVSNLKKTIENNFEGNQASLKILPIKQVNQGFEEIPVTGPGCVVQ